MSARSEHPCEARQRLARRVLVVGCGYLGLATARLLHTLGWEVLATTRTAASAAALANEPFPVAACDAADRPALESLISSASAAQPFAAAVFAASSNRGDAAAYRRVFGEGVRNVLEALSPHGIGLPAAQATADTMADAAKPALPKFIFTSSTSVYAQRDGGWVTEESEAAPERETGRILRAAEERVLAAGGTVARLAGLYGADRWAMRDRFLNGTATVDAGPPPFQPAPFQPSPSNPDKISLAEPPPPLSPPPAGRWVNSIHRADAASALAFLPGQPPGIYNVADGHPATQREIYEAFAAHFRRPLPPESPLLAPPDFTRKRGWTHKRVSCAKLRALGWNPLYASFREALGQ